MAFWVYILKCNDGSYCTGHTDNLESRIAQHHEGKITGYTHDKRPLTLMHTQDFPTRAEALTAEQRIKGWSRAKKEALIDKDWARLSLLAKSYGKSGSTGSPRTVEREAENIKRIGNQT